MGTLAAITSLTQWWTRESNPWTLEATDMTAVDDRRLLFVMVVVVVTIGCAHRDSDPFIHGSDELERIGATPPACFTAPLANCVDVPAERNPVERLASPWNEVFEPDLAHRICRGDLGARQRWLDGARLLEQKDPRERVYREFLGRCSSPDFCGWATTMAQAETEPEISRNLLFEGARRWCDGVVDTATLERVGASLGRSIADEKPWTTNSQLARCAEVSRHDDPWQDMAGLHAAGCFDLGGWIERHRGNADATAAAFERCVQKSEISYQEANCLRELAGLDRNRAVALVTADDRRGWGISSSITRYARILIRFPENGQLEAEMIRLALIPAKPSPPIEAGRAPVLPDEVLEHWSGLASFNPGCSARYCEHADLVYRLMELTSPILDDVILEERWPALEEVALGSGTQRISTSIGGVPVTLNVAGDEHGGFDRDDHDRLREAIAHAQDQPHELTAYSDGRAYRLRLRHFGDWYDLETVLAGLNTLLADRGSDLRYATLDPHCVPCAKVVAGPQDGLIEAAFAGLIEVTDPFKELWTQPTFKP